MSRDDVDDNSVVLAGSDEMTNCGIARFVLSWTNKKMEMVTQRGRYVAQETIFSLTYRTILQDLVTCFYINP